MKLKGKYVQPYTLNREAKKLVVEVWLERVEGRAKSRQNIYYGVATANDREIKHKDLFFCVNAEYMAEQIGLEIIEAWKARADKEGKSFRLKKRK